MPDALLFAHLAPRGVIRAAAIKLKLRFDPLKSALLITTDPFNYVDSGNFRHERERSLPDCRVGNFFAQENREKLRRGCDWHRATFRSLSVKERKRIDTKFGYRNYFLDINEFPCSRKSQLKFTYSQTSFSLNLSVKIPHRGT